MAELIAITHRAQQNHGDFTADQITVIFFSFFEIKIRTKLSRHNFDDVITKILKNK